MQGEDSNERNGSIINVTQDFRSYIEQTVPIQYESSWNSSAFLKSSKAALQQVIILEQKIEEFRKLLKIMSRFDKDKNKKIVNNIKEDLKAKQRQIKRLQTVQNDMKGSYDMNEQFRASVQQTLTFRLYQANMTFKKLYYDFSIKSQPQQSLSGLQKRRLSGTKGYTQSDEPSSQQQIDLNRSHFVEQTQEQVFEEIQKKQMKEIEKSIHDISEMYQTTQETILHHGMLIENIMGNIVDIDDNVIKGKGHVSEIHRRQSKNRSLIIKMFVTLYVITFVYIVILE